MLFEDVDYGTYTVRQVADITPYFINDFTIEFNANTDNVFYAFLEHDPNPVWTSDVHLITRDPKDGGLLRGACYELVGYSNVGCDENNDGQVTFDDIPLGDYTLHQVTPPAGYTRIEDYTLHVSWWTPNDFLGLVVQQAPKQTDGTTDQVSLVFMDVMTEQRVASPDTCAELVGGSLVGCDDSLVDGQIDFLAVEDGEYELRVHSLPEGYVLTYPDTVVTVYGRDTSQHHLVRLRLKGGLAKQTLMRGRWPRGCRPLILPLSPHARSGTLRRGRHRAGTADEDAPQPASSQTDRPCILSASSHRKNTSWRR